MLFPGEELVHFLLQVFARRRVNQAQLLFVDQHGLLRLPFVPGLFRHSVENVLALGAGVGWCVKAFQFLLVALAEYGSGHVYAPRSEACQQSGDWCGKADFKGFLHVIPELVTGFHDGLGL